MYLECANEKRAREYFGIRDEKFHILDFKEFLRKQSTTGPVDSAFGGDARMRVNTETPIAKRK
jgi:hypothetical protein